MPVLNGAANLTQFAAQLAKEIDWMLKQKHCCLLWMIFAFGAALSAAGPSRADQRPRDHGQMIIENVWATPAREGGRSILRLRVINEGREHAHLLGVETPVAANAHLIGRVSYDRTTTFDSISVRPDSNLDLTTDHIWIEIGPLTQAVKPGETIPLELVFVRSRLRVDAHVHSTDM